jgi:site-specific recombinase XerC
MTAFYVRWRDKQTGEALSQKFDDEADARFLLTVLKAHDSDTDAAHRSAAEFYAETFTVSKMVSEHIELLTRVNGYTRQRYKGNLKNHLTDGLGSADAHLVGYAEVSSWVQGMKSKGLSPKTIANVHGLLSAAFNTMVKLKKRQDNPCKGVSLPKNDATEEVSSFLTMDEWDRLSRFINEPHRSLFEFLAMTGLRFSEATALFARDFSIDSRGRTMVKIT